MLRRAIAFIVLLLAASPFTAPFQTWHLTTSQAADQTARNVELKTVRIEPEVVSPGSLVPTLRSEQPVDRDCESIEELALVSPPSRISRPNDVPPAAGPPGPYSPHLTVLRL
ncbi:MAG: hypothetical protein AB7F99_10175 [Vicinamibacterales bacterium]